MEYWRFNQARSVNLAQIEAGIDVRTTIMLRNIPNRTQFEIRPVSGHTTFPRHCGEVDEYALQNVGYAFVNIVRSEYIAVAGPTTFPRHCGEVDEYAHQNAGYAFVNIVRPEYIVEFVAQRVDKPWGLFQSQKRCEVSYATIQRIDCLLAKFRSPGLPV
jgi:hypothetical protein